MVFCIMRKKNQLLLLTPSLTMCCMTCMQRFVYIQYKIALLGRKFIDKEFYYNRQWGIYIIAQNGIYGNYTLNVFFVYTLQK